MRKLAKTTLRQIELNLSAGLTLKANNIASQYLSDHPDDIRLLQMYGLSLARLGAIEAAREQLERAFSLDPESGETLGILARVYKDLYKRESDVQYAVML